MLSIASTAAKGDYGTSADALRQLQLRHQAIADELLLPGHREEFSDTLRQDFESIGSVLKTCSLLRSAYPRALDFVASHGELWSSTLLYVAALEQGLKAVLVDARSIFKTDAEFTQANPLNEEIQEAMRREVHPKLSDGCIVITQGFIGSTMDGLTTTNGRGGSDYSAAVFAAALAADELQIWTDTSGVLSADPLIVEDAAPLEILSYEEATELSHYGAKVLHPKTLLPAFEKQIPVRVLNSKDPFAGGTRITVSPESIRGTLPGRPIQSITAKNNIILVSIRNDRNLQPNVLTDQALRAILHSKGGFETFTASKVGFSAVLEQNGHDETLLENLGRLGSVTLRNHRALLCIVGNNIARNQVVIAQILAALEELDIAVDHSFSGVSQHSTLFVIPEQSTTLAVRAIHEQFIEHVDEELVGSPAPDPAI
ncbi:MAG: aspartate kinase [Bacteroidetes bacterium]|nr:aspartate kinase [Bacteroidota bacterium]